MITTEAAAEVALRGHNHPIRAGLGGYSSALQPKAEKKPVEKHFQQPARPAESQRIF